MSENKHLINQSLMRKIVNDLKEVYDKYEGNKNNARDELKSYLFQLQLFHSPFFEYNRCVFTVSTFLTDVIIENSEEITKIKYNLKKIYEEHGGDVNKAKDDVKSYLFHIQSSSPLFFLYNKQIFNVSTFLTDIINENVEEMNELYNFLSNEI